MSFKVGHQNNRMMVYLSEYVTENCKGRAHPRPKQLDSYTVDEQAEHYETLAEESCQYCAGSGGVIECDFEDRGYYQVSHEYFEPCDCIDQE